MGFSVQMACGNHFSNKSTVAIVIAVPDRPKTKEELPLPQRWKATECKARNVIVELVIERNCRAWAFPQTEAHEFKKSLSNYNSDTKGIIPP